MVRKLIFVIVISFVFIKCGTFRQDIHNSRINVKKELEKELIVFIDFLDSIKGKNDKRVIYLIKYNQDNEVFYSIRHSNIIARNLTSFFSYPDSQFLVEKEVPWNGYTFIKGTLVCLYNNEDLKNIKHCGLDIVNYPMNFLAAKSYNKSKLIPENEFSGDFYVTLLKPKRRINHFCLVEINISDTLYIKYRKNKLRNATECIDNSLLY